MVSFSKFIPIPESIKAKSRVGALKERLDWGEPALTIVDVRARNIFNTSHIMGAIPMPMDELIDLAFVSLELIRDIYVYAETDEKTAEAALKLRKAGYQNVAELIGGLAAWSRASYPIDGV